MFDSPGAGEIILMQGLAFLMGLIPIAVAVWVLVLLVRMERNVDRMAAAIERLASLPPRTP